MKRRGRGIACMWYPIGFTVAANPSAAWTVALSATDVSTKLNLSFGTVTGFSVVSRGVSGRILSVTVTGDAGTATIGGSTFQQRLGLRDDRVWIDKDLRVGGAFSSRMEAKDGSFGVDFAGIELDEHYLKEAIARTRAALDAET